jgi:hypothetical protein
MIAHQGKDRPALEAAGPNGRPVAGAGYGGFIWTRLVGLTWPRLVQPPVLPPRPGTR